MKLVSLFGSARVMLILAMLVFRHWVIGAGVAVAVGVGVLAETGVVAAGAAEVGVTTAGGSETGVPRKQGVGVAAGDT